jgi:hypothetical protein
MSDFVFWINSAILAALFNLVCNLPDDGRLLTETCIGTDYVCRNKAYVAVKSEHFN